MSDLNTLTRPIIGIENRTAQEVFDIMCDRIRAEESPAPSSHVMGPTAKQIKDLTAWAREVMRFIDLCDADHDGYDDLHDDAETLTLAGYRLFSLDPDSDETSIQKLQSCDLVALAAFSKVTLDDLEVLRAASQELGNSFFDVATDKRTAVLDRLDALIKRLSAPAQPAPAEHLVKPVTLDVLRNYFRAMDAGDVPDPALALYSYLLMDGFISKASASAEVRAALAATSEGGE